MTSVIDGYNVLLDQYYDQMTPLTSAKAYMVGPGNHDVSLVTPSHDLILIMYIPIGEL